MTQIQRQAEGNPIIKASTDIRNGKQIQRGRWKTENGSFTVLSRFHDSVEIEKLKTKVSQVICGTNKVRHELNADIRNKLGLRGTVDFEDRLMILKNNYNEDVYNGKQFIVKNKSEIKTINVFLEKERRYESLYLMKVKDENGNMYTICVNPIMDSSFNVNVKLPEKFSNVLFVDYANVISLHKSQGSSYESVLLYTNTLKWMDKVSANGYARALYTGVTRAEKHCYVVI